MADTNALTFITGVKFYRSMLDYFNHVTFIYDPNWNPNDFSTPTFPVSFFHVKSMHEVMTSEVSQRQMLFYNSKSTKEGTEKVSGTNAGVLNVVADNIVIKPKTYKLDIIVPYQDLSLLNQSFVMNAETLQAINATFLQTTGSTKNFNSWATLSQPYIKFLRDILKTLLLQNRKSSSEEFINNVMNTPDYNKNSLEVMWRLRRIVKMKVWNSWQYKYVAITDIDITKEGTDDGVYEASITLQEMPIATLRPPVSALQKFEYQNAMWKLQGELAIKALDKAEISFSL